ncbi:MAG TPA: hypothetical protein VNH18_26470 [Bryobacteraceae bacterium]|nr:hypothetical protein [Bryobacteraceae bacterium]
MRKLSIIGLTAAVATCVIWAADWPSQSGNPQRDGWAKGEKAFTKENAGKIEFLYKYKAENQAKGLQSIGSPVVNGFLITYLGFKEMLAFAGSGDNVWSIDADLNRAIWKIHLDYKGDQPQVSTATSVCPGGLTAAIAMPGSSANAGARGGAPAGRGRAGAPGAGRGPVPPPTPPPTPPLLAAGNFGRGANFAAVSSDGHLHVLNSSTGAERTSAPIQFAPANAKLSALNINNNIVYAATQDGCGGNANAIYAVNLSSADAPKLTSFETNGGSAAGSGGTAIATDGTVFAQIPDGKGEVAGVYNDTVLALSPDLKVKDYFTPQGPALPVTRGVPAPGSTPLIFTFKGKEFVVAGGRDGRLYLLDAKAPGGADHQTPLFRTEPVAAADAKFSGNGFWGTFASWEAEAGGSRWVLASVWGPASAGTANGKVSNGAVVAFKVEEEAGKTVLTPAWTSRDMLTPAPVVIANGLVFALSTGQSARQAKENGTLYSVAEKQKLATRAVLYVLDGETGKELYSSGNTASTFSSAGVAVANRRIYFTTHDNFVYSLGFLAEQPQLTGK